MVAVFMIDMGESPYGDFQPKSDGLGRVTSSAARPTAPRDMPNTATLTKW